MNWHSTQSRAWKKHALGFQFAYCKMNNDGVMGRMGRWLGWEPRCAVVAFDCDSEPGSLHFAHIEGKAVKTQMLHRIDRRRKPRARWEPPSRFPERTVLSRILSALKVARGLKL